MAREFALTARSAAPRSPACARVRSSALALTRFWQSSAQARARWQPQICETHSADDPINHKAHGAMRYEAHGAINHKAHGAINHEAHGANEYKEHGSHDDTSVALSTPVLTRQLTTTDFARSAALARPALAPVGMRSLVCARSAGARSPYAPTLSMRSLVRARLTCARSTCARAAGARSS